MADKSVLPFVFVLTLAACGSPTGQGFDVQDAIGDVPADSTAVDAFSDTGGDTTLNDPGTVDGVIPDAPDAATGDVLPDSSIDGGLAVTLFDLSDVGDINAIWGSQDTSVWAVGDAGTVIVLRDGEFVPGPMIPTDADLYAIDGINGTVYVVGADGAAFRWRDGAWTDLDAPVTADLLAISCPYDNECFAVGVAGTIAHYLDGVWDVQDAGVTWTLYGVLSEVNGGTWIVGAFGSLFELSGTDWISSQIAGSASTMRDIWRADDGTMVAVGTGGTVVMMEPDSSRWEQQLTNDNYEPGRSLYAIAGDSSSDIWAVGDAGVILHFDGLHWELSTVDGPVNSLADLRGVLSAPWSHDDIAESGSGLLLAVGRMSSVVEYDEAGDAWVDRSAGPIGDLNSVWVSGSDGAGDPMDDEAVFVGDGGLVLEYRGGRFGLLESDVSSDLRGVSGGVVVGDAGTLLLVGDRVGNAPGAITHLVSSTIEDLVDVYGDDSGWVFAGAEGSVFQMDDLLSPVFTAQVSGILTSVCRTSAGIFVGGEAGLLAVLPSGVDSDTGFSDVVTFTQSTIRDLAPLPDGGVLAVGDNGIVLACGVQKCDRVYADPTSFLYGVGGYSPEGGSFDLFAAGWAGDIIRYDGDQVVPVQSGTSRVFFDVDGGDAASDRLYLAGQRGTAAMLDPSVLGAVAE